MKCAEVKHISAQAIINRKCAGSTCRHSPGTDSSRWRDKSCNSSGRCRCSGSYRRITPASRRAAAGMTAPLHFLDDLGAEGLEIPGGARGDDALVDYDLGILPIC